MVARRSARSERTQTTNQARVLVLTGPDDLRARFAVHTTAALVAGMAALRPRPGSTVGYATRIALRELVAARAALTASSGWDLPWRRRSWRSERSTSTTCACDRAGSDWTAETLSGTSAIPSSDFESITFSPDGSALAVDNGSTVYVFSLPRQALAGARRTETVIPLGRGVLNPC